MTLSEFLQQHSPGQQGDLYALTHLACLQISGTDAQTFLQGQFSNDVTSLTETTGQFNSYSSAKGRVISVFHLVKAPQGYYLILPAWQADSLHKRLQMFVLRADVQITNTADHVWLLGATRSAFDKLNIASHSIHTTQTTTLGLAYTLNTNRAIILAQRDQVEANWDKLQPHCVIDETTWEYHNILSGIPYIYPQTLEHFVAQMLDLDKLDAINFKKGCYPGQEVIARLHYRGKLKKALYHVSAAVSHPPGTLLYDKNDLTQSLGEIVDSRTAPSIGQSTGLAVLNIEKATDPSISWVDETGSSLTQIKRLNAD